MIPLFRFFSTPPFFSQIIPKALETSSGQAITSLSNNSLFLPLNESHGLHYRPEIHSSFFSSRLFGDFKLNDFKFDDFKFPSIEFIPFSSDSTSFSSSHTYSFSRSIQSHKSSFWSFGIALAASAAILKLFEQETIISPATPEYNQKLLQKALNFRTSVTDQLEACELFESKFGYHPQVNHIKQALLESISKSRNQKWLSRKTHKDDPLDYRLSILRARLVRSDEDHFPTIFSTFTDILNIVPPDTAEFNHFINLLSEILSGVSDIHTLHSLHMKYHQNPSLAVSYALLLGQTYPQHLPHAISILEKVYKDYPVQHVRFFLAKTYFMARKFDKVKELYPDLSNLNETEVLLYANAQFQQIKSLEDEDEKIQESEEILQLLELLRTQSQNLNPGIIAQIYAIAGYIRLLQNQDDLANQLFFESTNFVVFPPALFSRCLYFYQNKDYAHLKQLSKNILDLHNSKANPTFHLHPGKFETLAKRYYLYALHKLGEKPDFQLEDMSFLHNDDWIYNPLTADPLDFL